MSKTRGKGLFSGLTAFYDDGAVLQYRNTNDARSSYYVKGKDFEPTVESNTEGRPVYENEAMGEMPGRDDDKRPASKKKICIKCILGVAVLLCIGSLFFYNYQSGKSDANPYHLEKPVPKEIAMPLQDSGTMQFVKFLSAESVGNIDTVMAFFSPSIVRFYQLLAPNLAHIEDYYRDQWRSMHPLHQTLKKVEKLNRRTYIFTISESKASPVSPSDSSYEVVKRVIFNNHYRILSIKTIDTLNSY